ncbi:hypothetical protein ZOSMA_1110G00010 [Zostera marina]|uniref:Uncharacterized protein n=1 Tax=Zostera marina TaxID=29655 RepID=A0A0K9Q5H7_ZOSMR|nr:hypothetical protein ZOSMA_1110G00010 [Zostera marina]
MNMVTNDFKLLPIDVPWNQQDEAKTKKAIETIQKEFHLSVRTRLIDISMRR